MAHTVRLAAPPRSAGDTQPPLGEVAAVLQQQHRAASGGQHDARKQRERLDRLALALRKPGFAFLLEMNGMSTRCVARSPRRCR